MHALQHCRSSAGATQTGHCCKCTPVDVQSMVQSCAGGMASQIEVGVLHNVHGRLLVCGRLKYYPQHAFPCQDVCHCRNQCSRVPLQIKADCLTIFALQMLTLTDMESL